MASPTSTSDLLALTAQIVTAHVAGNKLQSGEVPALINVVYGALARVDAPLAVVQPQKPAVPIKRSVQHDYLVCLEDGAKMKTLKRYLRRFGLTADAYRAKWGLPKDYPMVAPAYAARRSTLAKQFGLGTALRTEQSIPEAPHLPIAVEASTVPVPEPEHTAASVFANFPGTEVPAETAAVGGAPEKAGRKRFAQQSMRVGRKRAETAR